MDILGHSGFRTLKDFNLEHARQEMVEKLKNNDRKRDRNRDKTYLERPSRPSHIQWIQQ